MRCTISLFIGTLALTVGCSAAGNDDEGKPASRQGPFGAIVGADGGATVGPPLTPSKLCAAMSAQAATDVWELRMDGDPPSAAGGDIVPGEYELVETYVFEPAPPPPKVETNINEDPGSVDGLETPKASPVTGKAARAYLTIGTDSMRRVTRSGTTEVPGTQDAAEVFFYVAEGSSLSTKSACPSAGTRGKMPYTATARGILLLPDAKHAEVYARVTR